MRGQPLRIKAISLHLTAQGFLDGWELHQRRHHEALSKITSRRSPRGTRHLPKQLVAGDCNMFKLAIQQRGESKVGESGNFHTRGIKGGSKPVRSDCARTKIKYFQYSCSDFSWAALPRRNCMLIEKKRRRCGTVHCNVRKGVRLTLALEYQLVRAAINKYSCSQLAQPLLLAQR